jgi:predicted AlkP superfamily phosphohydrolase/phosphomutase
MSNETARRVMIIGLDGATLDLIRPWVEEGILPTFKKLMQNGVWGPLRSVMPPLTPAAWSSFITGVNPGKHGIFDFTTRPEQSYDTSFVHSGYRQAPSLWQLAGNAGKRVIVYNVPLTYPPERVNGLLVSGLMTPPGAADASYPPELQQELKKLIPGLVLSDHSFFRPGRELELVHELSAIHAQNFKAANYLMHRQPWDLFVMVFQHTDTVEHFLWKHMENHGTDLPESSREVVANAIRDCYRDLDTKLGELIQEAGNGIYVMVVSDHGHGPMRYGFSVNTWLLEKGYIQLKRDPVTRFKYLLYRAGLTPALVYRLLSPIQIAAKIQGTGQPERKSIKARVKRIFLSMQDFDWSRTRAYSIGSYGPVFVNLKGREPNGIIERGKEYDSVVNQLISDLKTIQDPGSGSPLFSEFHRRDEIYSGPFIDHAPDLLFFPRNPEYYVAGWKEFDENRWLSQLGDNTGRLHSMVQMRVPYTGSHRMDGILFFSGPDIRSGIELSGASIMDITPTALSLLGVPIPVEMDGRVLENVMLPELLDRLNITHDSVAGLRPEVPPAPDLTPEEEEILVKRLRNLGYVA